MKAKKKRARSLKRIEAGKYLYGGYWYITDHGYDRVCGHRVWDVSNEEGNYVVDGETLNHAIEKLEALLEYMKIPSSCGVCG